QHTAGRVEQHIVEVISKRRKPPELILDPEAGEDQRIVLRAGTRLKPDGIEPFKIAQVDVIDDVLRIVPDVSGAQRWEIGNEGDDQQRRRPRDEDAHPSRRRLAAVRFRGSSSSSRGFDSGCHAPRANIAADSENRYSRTRNEMVEKIFGG